MVMSPFKHAPEPAPPLVFALRRHTAFPPPNKVDLTQRPAWFARRHPTHSYPLLSGVASILMLELHDQALAASRCPRRPTKLSTPRLPCSHRKNYTARRNGTGNPLTNRYVVGTDEGAAADPYAGGACDPSHACAASLATHRRRNDLGPAACGGKEVLTVAPSWRE